MTSTLRNLNQSLSCCFLLLLGRKVEIFVSLCLVFVSLKGASQNLMSSRRLYLLSACLSLHVDSPRHCITKAPGKRFLVPGETCPRVSSPPAPSGTRRTCYNFPSTPQSWFAVSRARGEISGSLLKHQLIKRLGDNRRTREVVIGRRVCQGRFCKILY